MIISIKIINTIQMITIERNIRSSIWNDMDMLHRYVTPIGMLCKSDIFSPWNNLCWAQFVIIICTLNIDNITLIRVKRREDVI